MSALARALWAVPPSIWAAEPLRQSPVSIGPTVVIDPLIPQKIV